MEFITYHHEIRFKVLYDYTEKEPAYISDVDGGHPGAPAHVDVYAVFMEGVEADLLDHPVLELKQPVLEELRARALAYAQDVEVEL